LREGLLAALGALRSIEVVGQVDSASQAVVIEHEPSFVLVSIEGPEHNYLAAIQKIKAQWPAVRCVALVDTVAQQRAALTIGAEEVLIKGVRPQVLLEIIEQLLSNERPVPVQGATPAG